MKIQLIFIKSKKLDWSIQARESLVKKISLFCSVSTTELKASEGSVDKRKKSEGEKILKALNKNHSLICLDENGSHFQNSKDFSDFLIKSFSFHESGLAFVIGGAYGLSEDIKKKSEYVISLSSLTMNHHVAFVVLLEQIYRGLSIWKSLPYHND